MNKEKMRMKNSLMVLLMGLALAACNPSKVIDPYDPAFDISQFDIQDYNRDSKLLEEVFRQYLPLGTKKSKVDEFLLKNGDVIVIKADENGSGYSIEKAINSPPLEGKVKDIFFYRWSFGSGGFSPAAHGVYVMYDSNNQVLQMYHLNTFVFNLK